MYGTYFLSERILLSLEQTFLPSFPALRPDAGALPVIAQTTTGGVAVLAAGIAALCAGLLAWQVLRARRAEAACARAERAVEEHAAALESEREQVSEFLSAVHDGVLVHRNGIPYFVNPAFERLTGYGVDELVGQRVLNFLPTPASRVEIARRMATGDESPYRAVLVAKSGEHIPVEIHGKAVARTTHAAERIVLVRDLRNPTEQQLLAQRTRLKELYALTAEAEGTPEDQLARALENACELFGLDLGIISRVEDEEYTVVACYAPGTPLAVGDTFALDTTYCNFVMESGSVVAISHMGLSPRAGHPCYTTFELEAYIGVPLFVRGAVYGTLNFSSSAPRALPFGDLEIETIELLASWVGALLERQEAEAEREVLAHRNKLILDSISDGFFVLDRDWRFTHVNPNVGPLVDREDPADLLGRNIWEVYPDAVGNPLWEAYHRAFETGSAQTADAYYAPLGRHYRGRAFPHDEGLSVFFQDVTGEQERARALRESESRMRAILGALPDLMFRLGRDGTYLDVQTPDPEALAVPADQIIGTRIPDVIAQPMADVFMRLIEKTLETGEVQQHEYALQVMSGEERYFDARVAAAGDDEVILVVRDITERHKQEKALRESEERLDLAISGAELGLWDWNVATGSVTFNDRWAEMLGYRLDEITPHVDTWGELVHPEDLPEVMETLQAHMEGRTPYYQTEHRMRHKDGSWRWILDRGKVVERAEDGTPLRAAGTHLDITERIESERLLRESQLRYQLVAENMQDLVCLHAPDGIYRWVSPSVETLLGYTPDDLLGQNPYDFFHPEDARHIREGSHERVLETKERDASLTTYRMRRSDGTYVWLETVTEPLLDEAGEVMKLQTTSRNVTERVEAMNRLVEAQARAEAADQAKSAFLANMSHEIRTPMNGIIGMAELLSESSLDGMQREQLDVIVNSSEALLALINDILDFSKIEAGQFEIVEAPFELHRFLDRAVSVVSTAARGRNNTVSIEKAAGLPGRIVGDELRVRQVLLNLLSNAVKFTENGEIIVEAMLLPKGDTFERGGQAYLQIAVHDTGIGIPPEKLDRLFARFDQLDASTTRKYGGTGLGLAISRRLVEMMGGQVEVESEVGSGSTFRFTVEVGVPDEQPATEAYTLAGRHLLLVSGDEACTSFVEDYAQRWGMACTTVASGDDALEAFRADAPIDLVAVCSPLHGETPREVARTLRGVRPAVPIALMAAPSTPEPGTAPIPKGFDDWIALPLRRTALHALFSRVLLAHGKEAIPGTLTLQADNLLGVKAPLSILLVEDGTANQAVATRMLHRLGYAADLAENGQEAVDAVRRGAYDVVFMDVQMPVMDGVEATRLIRADLPEDAQPWIIGLTANAVVGDRERYLSAGMDDYLSKPVRLGALEEALRRALGARRSTTPDAPDASDALPLLDPGCLKALRHDLGREGYEEVVDVLVASIHEYVAEVQEGIAAGAWTQVERAAHTLYGTAGSVGAQRLIRLGKQMEKAAIQQDEGGARLVIEALARCADETTRAILPSGLGENVAR